jgi:hypothetical protein
MRAILVLLALAVLGLAAALYFGVVSLSAQPGEVRPPTVRADVGRVSVGREERTISVPTVEVQRADNAQAPR